MSTAKSSPTFPSLRQLATAGEFHTWALIAVDYLIEQKGLAVVLEYFSLFRNSNNREQNFSAAFGESPAAFDAKFSRRMTILLGR